MINTEASGDDAAEEWPIPVNGKKTPPLRQSKKYSYHCYIWNCTVHIMTE